MSTGYKICGRANNYAPALAQLYPALNNQHGRSMVFASEHDKK